MPSRLREGIAVTADIVGLVPAISFAVGVMILWLGPMQIAWIAENRGLLVAGLIGFLIGLVVSTIVMLRHIRRYLLGYEWLEGTYTYHIDQNDHKRHRATTKVKVRALRDDVRIFENRYFWSGEGSDPAPQSTVAGQVVLEPMISDGAYRYYFVALNPPLARHEVREIEVVHNFYDTLGRFEPFYAKVVAEPVGKLRLIVELPGQTILDASIEERASKAPRAKVKRKETAPVNQTRDGINWKIDGKPRRNHYYRIDWSSR